MKKEIKLVIKNCSQCPYKSYDSHYNRSKDSGYDCSKKHKRIIDDWEYSNSNNPNALCNEKNDWCASIPMPKWCPLPNVIKNKQP